MVPEALQRTRLAGARLLVFLCAAASLLSQASGATPAAEYTITLNQGIPITTPGSFGQGGAIGEIEILPAPSAFASVAGQGTSIVHVQYWFRVEGPLPNVEVPIEIAGRVEIAAGNAVFEEDMIWGVSAQMVAQAYDGPLGPGVNEVDNDLGSIGCNPNSVGPIPVPLPIPTCSALMQDEPVLLTLSTRSGADNRVTLLATANNMEAFSANFFARVDPVISFAPGFDPTGYSIELSEGVGNTVPEPGAPLLLGAGASLLLLLRARKQPRDS